MIDACAADRDPSDPRGAPPGPSPRALVIGYGSPLRRDDAVGHHVAARVTEMGARDVEVMAVHQLAPELAEALARVERAVFVDARGERLEAGVEVVSLRDATASAVFAHFVRPSGLLALARALYGRAPEGFLVTIPAHDMGLGEGLSEATRGHVDDAARAVAALLDLAHATT